MICSVATTRLHRHSYVLLVTLYLQSDQILQWTVDDFFKHYRK
jgi:hypothetical protein